MTFFETGDSRVFAEKLCEGSEQSLSLAIYIFDPAVFFEPLVESKTVKSLRFQGVTYPDICFHNEKNAIQALRANRSVTSLALSSCTTTDDTYVALGALLEAGLAPLASLALPGSSSGLRGYTALARGVAASQHLTALDLSGTAPGNAGVKVIAANLGKLRRLVLTSCGIGDQGALALAAAVTEASSLRELLLGSNSLGAASAVALSGALGVLERLDVSDNQLGDRGAEALAGALTADGVTVTGLGLAKNYLTASGTLALALGIAGNRSLTWLSVGFCGLDAVSEQALREAVSGHVPPVELELECRSETLLASTEYALPAFTADGKILVVAFDDAIRFFSTADFSEVRSLRLRRRFPGSDFIITPDGSEGVVVSMNVVSHWQSVAVLEMFQLGSAGGSRMLQPMWSREMNLSSVRRVGPRLVVVSGQVLTVLRWADGRILGSKTFPVNLDAVEAVGDTMIIVKNETGLIFVDLVSLDILHASIPVSGIGSMAVSTSRGVLATAANGRVVFWDLATHQCKGTCGVPLEGVMDLAFSPSGEHLLATYANSDLVAVVSMKTGEVVTTLSTRAEARLLFPPPGPDAPPVVCVYHKRSNRSSTTGSLDLYYFFEFAAGSPMMGLLEGPPFLSLVHQDAAAVYLAVSPDGSLLCLSPRSRGGFVVYDTRTMSLVATLEDVGMPLSGHIQLLFASNEIVALAACSCLFLWDARGGSLRRVHSKVFIGGPGAVSVLPRASDPVQVLVGATEGVGTKISSFSLDADSGTTRSPYLRDSCLSLVVNAADPRRAISVQGKVNRAYYEPVVDEIVIVDLVSRVRLASIFQRSEMNTIPFHAAAWVFGGVAVLTAHSSGRALTVWDDTHLATVTHKVSEVSPGADFLSGSPLGSMLRVNDQLLVLQAGGRGAAVKTIAVSSVGRAVWLSERVDGPFREAELFALSGTGACFERVSPIAGAAERSWITHAIPPAATVVLAASSLEGLIDPKTKTLNLSGSILGNIGLDRVAALLGAQSYGSLTSLDLRFEKLTVSTRMGLAKALARLDNLPELVIYNGCDARATISLHPSTALDEAVFLVTRLHLAQKIAIHGGHTASELFRDRWCPVPAPALAARSITVSGSEGLHLNTLEWLLAHTFAHGLEEVELIDLPLTGWPAGLAAAVHSADGLRSLRLLNRSGGAGAGEGEGGPIPLPQGLARSLVHVELSGYAFAAVRLADLPAKLQTLVVTSPSALVFPASADQCPALPNLRTFELSTCAGLTAAALERIFAEAPVHLERLMIPASAGKPETAITRLPASLANEGMGLPNLVALDVTGHGLVGPLTCIGPSTVRLERLDMADNPAIGVLPPVPAEAPLRDLNCTDCSITVIPTRFADVPSLNYTNNDIVSPPSEVAVNGWPSVQAYLEELRTSGSHHNTQTKLFIVGLGEVGKTSLLKAMMSPDGRCAGIGKDDRTFGVDVHEWDYKEESMRLIVSDFAGQKIYYSTHQFFLQPRGVYLLIVRPFMPVSLSAIVAKYGNVACGVCDKPLEGKEDEFFHLEGRGHIHARCVDLTELVSDWLRRIYFRVPGAHILCVMSRADTIPEQSLLRQAEAVKTEVARLNALLARNVEIAHAAEKQALGGQSSPRLRLLALLCRTPLRVTNHGTPFLVDSVSGRGVQDLKAAIAVAVRALPSWREEVPLSYMRLAEKVVALREAKPARGITIPWEEYNELCVTSGLREDTQIKVATEFLHATGVLLHFANLGATLKDMVFPDPQSAGDLMKAVVSHDLLKGSGGGGGSADLSSELRLQITALVRRGVLDHGTLLPFLLKRAGLLPEGVLATRAMVDALGEVLWDFGVGFKDEGYFQRTGMIRSYIPCMAGSSNSLAGDGAAGGAGSGSITDFPFQATVAYSVLPEGFFFRLLAVHPAARPRQTSSFFAARAAFFLHGRKTSVTMRDRRGGDGTEWVTTLELTSASAADLDALLASISAVESFFSGLNRVSLTMKCCGWLAAEEEVGDLARPRGPTAVEPETHALAVSGSSLTPLVSSACTSCCKVLQTLAPDVVIIANEMTQDGPDRDAITTLQQSLASEALVTSVYGGEDQWPVSVKCAVICLDNRASMSNHFESALLKAIPFSGVSVVVCRLPSLIPFYKARAKTSAGLHVQRVWPEFAARETAQAAADIMGGQIVRAVPRELNALRNDVALLISQRLSMSSMAARSPLPPGHALARFPRSIPGAEFVKLLGAMDDAERRFVDSWFDADAAGARTLRRVDEMIPNFLHHGNNPAIDAPAGGADPVPQDPEREWRGACERLTLELGRAAVKALAGPALRPRRDLYVTGFEVPCPLCLSEEAPQPYLFSRDDVINIFRTEPDVKSIPCDNGHASVLIESILRPDAFFSYAWGLGAVTQRFVSDVKTSLESGTATDDAPGFIVWFDLERMKGDSQRAMREGVEQSGLVVVFLDLAYLRSAPCNLELTAAIEKGKHVVPIVLPGFNPESPFDGLDSRTKVDKDDILRKIAFLSPTKASDSNVAVPLRLGRAGNGETFTKAHVAAAVAHVSEVIIARSARDSLLSATGFASKRATLTSAMRFVHTASVLRGISLPPSSPKSRALALHPSPKDKDKDNKDRAVELPAIKPSPPPRQSAASASTVPELPPLESAASKPGPRSARKSGGGVVREEC